MASSKGARKGLILDKGCCSGTLCRQFRGGNVVGLAACGRCIFHVGCVSPTDKCEQCHVAVGELDVGRLAKCLCSTCKSRTPGLCSGCEKRLLKSVESRLRVHHTLSRQMLESAIQQYPGFSELPPLLLGLVGERILAALECNWRYAVTSRGVRDFVDVIHAAHQKTPVPMNHVELVRLGGYGFIEAEAVTELRRSIEGSMRLWKKTFDNKLALVSTLVSRTDSADGLYGFLEGKGVETSSVASVVGLYPGAPLHLITLIEEGRAHVVDGCVFSGVANSASPLPRPERQKLWRETTLSGRKRRA